MKKTFAALIAVPLLGFPLISNGAESPDIKVQAYSVTHTAMTPNIGESCAGYLRYLIRDNNYKLIEATAMQGPPGVLYTLQKDNAKEMALIKCGRACGGDHEDGGDGGCEH